MTRLVPRSLMPVVALAAVLSLLFAGVAFAHGETHMGDGTPGVHEPGTGMTDAVAGDGHHMFGDAAGCWYEDYAQHMAEHQFMNGYADGRFGGDDDITRGQFAAIMARMLGMGPEAGAPFSDTAGHWAEGHIAAMVHAGIINGHPDGTFGPYERITRAQMAAMMDRALEHLGQGLTEQEREQLRDQVRQHLTDAAGHWAEGHIAHMYQLGITQGDATGHFRPDEHTNRAQAAAMLWRLYEGQLQ